jgi:hypothetical protein
VSIHGHRRRRCHLVRRRGRRPRGRLGQDLIIPTGRRKGSNPSLASIYRALAEHARREAFPDAVGQAHAEFLERQART